MKRKIILSFTLSSLLFTTNLFGVNSSNLNYLTMYNGKLYFQANDGVNGTELWESDGTEAGTKILKDINSGGNSSPSGFIVFNNKLYFQANDGVNGTELWESDGTEAGTKILKDINSGGNSSPSEFIVFNNKLYFQANDGVNGAELWESDGTEAGTKIFKDIYMGNSGSSVSNFIIFNDKLYFSASDENNGTELWESNGSADGTQIVKDIYTGDGNFGPNGSVPSSLVVYNGKLYFGANDGVHGRELWESNGSADGTQLFKDIYIGDSISGSSPNYMTVYNGNFYFSATDGNHGSELWVSDGTSNGTTMVKDIRSGGFNSNSTPKSFAILNNKLYFSADDGVNGLELWESDGTEVGTKILKDIQVGSNGSSLYSLITFNNKLYFRANDGVKGLELWESDGTEAGTKIVKDIYLDNTPPTALNVVINGTIDVGETLTGSYDFSDYDNHTEINSTYQWYRSDDTNGTNIEAISSAKSKTYTITTLDSEKYLLFSVTPNDGIDSGDEVNSSYSSQVPIKVDFSSLITANKWNMLSVPDERNVSVSDLSGATIWTFNNTTNQWEQPSTLTAGKGYMLYTSSSINSVSATATSSTITDDNTTIKSISNETWTLVGISKNTNGFSWSEIYNPKNTLKSGCDYIQVFYYDSSNATWNTSSNIPYLGAIWVKQNCLND